MKVWAPNAHNVSVVINPDGKHERITALQPTGEPGWFDSWVHLLHGEDYLLDLDGTRLPDPRCRWMPAGVHGPSRCWDPSTVSWSDKHWRGRSLRDSAVVYELHVGTFTQEGTLDSAIERLGHLVELGITHVELMPLAAFDGIHGWGYDGVAINAVHDPYGGPDALCRFVDECHARGLAVLLDVVHNHLGPSGNYWSNFGPFLTDAHQTPWGEAVNLDAPGSDDVRQILIESALGWLRDFHLDGLRLDAVHELVDNRALTYLEELAASAQGLGSALGRTIEVIAESDRNDPRTVISFAAGGVGMTAQWDDDVHHALHWLFTGESSGYYVDFDSPAAVTHTLEMAFRHDGDYSTFRGRSHGRPVDFSKVDPWRFVVATQTHDQIGNRAQGDRLSALVDINRCAGAATLLFCLPYTPMLFMGEEFAADTPWQFFTSYPEPELGAAVTQGRRDEFANYEWAGEVPDPQDRATRDASVLDWSTSKTGDHQRLVRWYRTMIKLRADNPTLSSAPAIPGARTAGRVKVEVISDNDDQPIIAIVMRRGNPGFVGATNLSDVEQSFELAIAPERIEAAWPKKSSVRLDGYTVRLAAGASIVASWTRR